MNLTRNFTLAEMTASQTAARRGLDNTPPAPELAELQKTAELLERVRAILEKPVMVSSGYRSFVVNEAVGGAVGSAHTWGGAADFIAPAFGPPLAVARELASYAEALDFDQLIYEWDSWVHIGRALPKARPRRQVLTIDGRGTRTGL